VQTLVPGTHAAGNPAHLKGVEEPLVGRATEAVGLGAGEGGRLVQDDGGGQGAALAPVGVDGGEQKGVHVVAGEVRLTVVAADPRRPAADDDTVAEGAVT
jgi:hypothetical protein